MGRLSAENRRALENDIRTGNIDNFIREYLKAAAEGDPEFVADIRNELIRILKQDPGQIIIKNLNGNTLLHLAFLNDAPVLAKALLDLDLDLTFTAKDLLVNISNNAGQIPFAIAKQRNKKECVDLIVPYSQAFCSECLRAGAIGNFVNTYVLTVDVQIAGLAESIRTQATTFLRANPEKRYVKDTAGNTLLHLSSLRQCRMLTQTLLELDLEFIGDESELLLNTKNAAGQTPLAQTLEAKDTEGTEIFVKYNASFYLERDSAGTYLSAQYSLTGHLAELLPLGQTLQPERLTKVLTIARAKKDTFSDPFLFREYLDRIAIRLIGLTGDGSGIDFKQWAELYANSVSKVSELCTIDSCFKFGEDFGESVNYLLIHIRALLELVVTGGSNSTLENELLLAINTAKIDQETTLLNMLRQNNETMISHHVNGLHARLQSCPLLCYPGGWPGQTGVPGHAIYIDIALIACKVADEKTSASDPQKIDPLHQYQVGVYNLGAGLNENYNRTLMVTDNFALPAIAPNAVSEEFIDGYLYRLVWANLNGTTEDKIAQALDYIYDEDLFGRPVNTLAKRKQAEIIQAIGNCLVKNFLFAMRNHLGDNLYRAAYLQILSINLEQIKSYCGELPKPRDIVQALETSEIVFNKINLIDIQYMQVFRNKNLPCKVGNGKERKEGEESKRHKDKETLNRVTNGIGLFSFVDKPAVYHRGQLLKYEEKASVSAPSRFSRRIWQ